MLQGCGSVGCALWWSGLVHTSYISTNVSPRVHALYGIAAAWRAVIGCRTDCFASRTFSVHSWFPFQSHLLSLSAPHLSHVDTHNTEYSQLYTPFTMAFFGQIVAPSSLPVPTYSSYNRRVLRKSRCSHLKQQQRLFTRCRK